MTPASRWTFGTASQSPNTNTEREEMPPTPLMKEDLIKAIRDARKRTPLSQEVSLDALASLLEKQEEPPGWPCGYKESLKAAQEDGFSLFIDRIRESIKAQGSGQVEPGGSRSGPFSSRTRRSREAETLEARVLTSEEACLLFDCLPPPGWLGRGNTEEYRKARDKLGALR